MSSNTPPALRPQHNGWSPERQRRFLDHLALHGSVAAAARAAGMSRQSAYWLRLERRKSEALQHRNRPDSSQVAKLRAELRALAAMPEQGQPAPVTSAGG